MNNEERREILRMLAEEKINVKEAEMLLRALSETADARKQPDTEDEKSKEGEEIFQEVTKIFQGIGREIEGEVSKAVESVQRFDVGKIVNEVVEQVKSSVSDAIDITEEGDGKRKVREQLDWTFDGAGVSRIDAQTVNGSISLKGSDHDQVIVRAWKKVRGKRFGAEEFAQEVEVCVEQIGDEIRIYHEHPKPPKGVNVIVRYEIESPRTVDVNLRTVNDKVQISGIDGAIDATTVNGPIKLEGETGPIHAHTTNGEIETDIGLLINNAKFSTTNGSIDVKVHAGVAPVIATTTNGSIDLTLPADFAGCLDAKTNNGRVHSDFPILVAGKIKNRLEGKIGEGGEALVKLRNLNGSIHLRQR